MTKHTFSVEPRTLTGRAVKKLRRQGLIPGNIFGKNRPSQAVQAELKSFTKLYKEVGESSLIYLQLPKQAEEYPVFISQVTVHPVTGAYLHINFHQVSLKEKVSAPVPLVLSGEAPAETDKLGILVQQLDEVEIEALPTDMPENLPVDISALAQVGDSVTVGQLPLDTSKYTLKTPPDTIIVQIQELAKEEVAVPPTPAETEASSDSGAAPEASAPTEPAPES